MVEIPTSVTNYTDCSISTIHHTLQASRRRLAIGLIAHRAISSATMQTADSTTDTRSGDEVVTSVRQLAKEVVAIEEDVSVENASGDPYHNVYTSLIQTHLPKLDDIAAIDYNSDRKMVTPDQNLLALSMVAAITSPVAQLLFHDAVARFYAEDTSSGQDAITD